jgi:hypothetical protein
LLVIELDGGQHAEQLNYDNLDLPSPALSGTFPTLEGVLTFRQRDVEGSMGFIRKHSLLREQFKVIYYHHLLGAVLVHPDRREVIPLAPEPIVKGDGDTKNDCERNPH